MAHVIILEGPDGAGKTTLAQYLVKHANFQYVHSGPPKPGEDLLLTYASTLDSAIRINKDVVIDRLYAGESIYGPVIRKHDHLGEEGQKIMQRIVRGQGVLEVFCLPPYRTCYSNWFKRQQAKGELVTDSNTFHTIYHGYEMLAKKQTFAYSLTYDYSKTSLEVACGTLLSSLATRERLPPGVIGQPGAKFLIVGEVANHDNLDLPWVSLENSSHYLNTALWDAGFLEEEMAFVNANTIYGEENDPEQILAWKPTIIAFGKIASRWCRSVNHFKMPHPAYWKRFHSQDRGEFIKRLKQIHAEAYRG
jgi:hypothetical protein